ncbi:MAG: LysR family transcriptional regulator [Bacteroidota bacterium]
MELRQLRYFVTLAETLHFGKAAEMLHMSQPPLSRAIKNLEEDLGYRLLERTRRKVELTPEGRFLYDEAQRLLERTRYIRETMGKISAGDTGRLRIGYIGSVMYSVLPEMLSRFSAAFPNVTTSLHEMTNEEQMENLQMEAIDVGFVRMPFLVDGVDVRLVFEEGFSLVLPKGHSWLENPGQGLKALAAEPFLAFSGACSRSVTDAIMRICKRAGFIPRVVHETSQLNTILRLVESGLGFSIVPAKVSEAYELNLEFVELTEFEEKAELSVAYPAANSNPVLANFLEFI